MEQDHFSQIETYLNGGLGELEKQQFIEEAAKDPALKAAILNHLAAKKAMEKVLRQKNGSTIRSHPTKKRHCYPSLPS